MKKHIRLFIVLFPVLLAFLGQGCRQEEFPPDEWPETDNRAAAFLMRRLQESPQAYKNWDAALNGQQPFYEYIRLMSLPQHGLCYFVPYGLRHVEGAIIYPVESMISDDATYDLNAPWASPTTSAPTG